MLEGVHFTTHSVPSQKFLFSSLIISLPTAATDPQILNCFSSPKHLVFFLPLFLPLSPSVCGVDLMISVLSQPKATLTQGLTHEPIDLTLQTAIPGFLHLHPALQGLSVQGTFAFGLFLRPSDTFLMPALYCNQPWIEGRDEDK